MPVFIQRSDAGDLAGQVSGLEHAQKVFGSDMSVFSTGAVKRVSPGQEIKSQDYGFEGELIIPTGDGCGRYVSEMASALSEKAASIGAKPGEAFEHEKVDGVTKAIIENAFKHGSKAGEDVYVGWSVSDSLMIITVVDQGKMPFNPFMYADEPSPEKWLRYKDNAEEGGHDAITAITGKGVGGKKVREPELDYIEWVSLDDAGGRKQGTKVNMIFKPKPTLK